MYLMLGRIGRGFGPLAGWWRCTCGPLAFVDTRRLGSRFEFAKFSFINTFWQLCTSLNLKAVTVTKFYAKNAQHASNARFNYHDVLADRVSGLEDQIVDCYSMRFQFRVKI